MQPFPPKPFGLLSFFSSPSLCTGVKRYSEDSSEYALLLVENFFLTTPFGRSPDGNFWHLSLPCEISIFHCFGSLADLGEEGHERVVLRAASSPFPVSADTAGGRILFDLNELGHFWPGPRSCHTPIRGWMDSLGFHQISRHRFSAIVGSVATAFCDWN